MFWKRPDFFWVSYVLVIYALCQRFKILIFCLVNDADTQNKNIFYVEHIHDHLQLVPIVI